MVGLVVATHGRLGEELIRTAEGIVGAIASARSVSISAGRPVEEARAELGEAIRAVDAGEGTLVLTDMFGGTPANLALTFLDGRVEVLTGVNLPMVLKFAATRGDGLSLGATAELLAGYGQKNITRASELLRQRTAGGGRP
ncbi:MAG TPA: PTS fructose transporter subunit IIA [Anaeromyxobacteraceae bacterium]